MNIIEEFMVSLGFQTQLPQLAAFQNALNTAQGAVTKATNGMVGALKTAEEAQATAAVKAGSIALNITSDLAKWQAAIVGIFSAIATGSIAVVDKVAMADQGVRLFAQRMFMSQDAAEQLKGALDTLGVSMEQAIWDPELNARAQTLAKDIRTIQESGRSGDFKQQLKDVRELHFQIDRLKLVLEKGIGQVVVNLLGSFGGVQSIVEKIKGFTDYLVANYAKIAAWFSEKFGPILLDTKSALKDTWSIVKDLIGGIVNLIGILSGDDSLQGTAVTFDKIATAVQTVVHWMAIFVHWISLAERVVVKLVSGLLLMASALVDLASGQPAKALEELGKANSTGNGMGDDLKELLKFSYHTLQSVGAPGEKQYSDQVRADMGQSGGMAGFKNASGIADASLVKFQESINKAAKAYGVDPALIKSIIAAESSGNPNVTSNKGAMGLMQLMPGTARGLGVNNAYDADQNIQGGTKYLAQLLREFRGDQDKVIAAYNFGPGNIEKHRTLPEETRNYLARVNQNYARYSSGSAIVSGSNPSPNAGSNSRDIQIGSIHVSVTQPNATPDQIQRAVAAGVRDEMRRANRRDLVELGAT